jgi:hypothetical protein
MGGEGSGEVSIEGPRARNGPDSSKLARLDGGEYFAG